MWSGYGFSVPSFATLPGRSKARPNESPRDPKVGLVGVMFMGCHWVQWTTAMESNEL